MNTILTYLKRIFTKKKDGGMESHISGVDKADDILQSLIEDGKILGLAITVLREDKTVFQRGYGYADLEKKIRVGPEKTIFRIASISKNIAAHALAHMVRDKIMDLDASLYDYVPYFPKKQYDFTIRQLANHTAGIRGYRGREYGLNRPYSIKDGLEIFMDDELLFKPGTDYHYSSYDWVLISLAMQEASGIPFEDYVRQKVLEPMGMKNTFVPKRLSGHPPADKDENRKDNRAVFYSKNRFGFRKAIPVNNFYKLAGGGYLSTSNDIAKFGRTYLNRKVLEDEVVSQFLTSEVVKGKPTYYGLGWQVSEDKKGRSFLGHIGNGVGGYSNLFIYPKEQMVFSILINCSNPGIQDELDSIVDIFISKMDVRLQFND